MATCATTVLVEDTTAPEFTLAPDTTILWPPNHRMVPVGVVWQVSDICDPGAGVALIGAASSEPDDAPGDGDGETTGDIEGDDVGTPDTEIILRAERSGSGGGRLYTLKYAASDASGNQAMSQATVMVPHDQGQGMEPLVLTVEPNGSPGFVDLSWIGVTGSLGYDVLRGDLANLRAVEGRLSLGSVQVLARGTIETGTPEAVKTKALPVGRAQFYVVQYRDLSGPSGYGTVTAPLPREPEWCGAGCP